MVSEIPQQSEDLTILEMRTSADRAGAAGLMGVHACRRIAFETAEA